MYLILIAMWLLALRNLWHDLHMFKYILELGVENKKTSWEKTVLIIWSQIHGKMALLVCKITLKNIIIQIWF